MLPVCVQKNDYRMTNNLQLMNPRTKAFICLITVTAFMSLQALGQTITMTDANGAANGITQGALRYGQTNIVLFGFGVTISGTCTLSEFHVTNPGNSQNGGYFANGKLYRSTGNTFASATQISASVGFYGSQVAITNINQAFTNQTYYYFLVADFTQTYGTIPSTIQFRFANGQSPAAVVQTNPYATYNNFTITGTNFTLAETDISISDANDVSNGITQGSLIYGQNDIVLFGFGVTVTGVSTISGFKINSTNSSPASYFGNGKIYCSFTNVFSSATLISGATVSFSYGTPLGVTISGLTESFNTPGGQTLYYFIVEDFNNTNGTVPSSIRFQFDTSQTNAITQSSPTYKNYGGFDLQTGKNHSLAATEIVMIDVNGVANGITQGGLSYGQKDIVMFGFGMKVTGLLTMNTLNIKTTNNDNYFSNGRLYRSSDNIYSVDDIAVGSVAFYGNNVPVTSLNESFTSYTGQTNYYFLVGDFTNASGAAGTITFRFERIQTNAIVQSSPYKTYGCFTTAGREFTILKTYVWTGTAWNDEENWNNPDNWSWSSTIPGASDNAFIGSGNFVQPMISSGTFSVGRVTFGTAKAVTLTVNGTLTIVNELIQQSAAGASIAGVITGTGSLIADNLRVGNSVIPTSSQTTKITSSISNLIVNNNLILSSKKTGSYVNNATFELPSGTTTINGFIQPVNDAGVLSTFTMNTGAQTGTLKLSGANPFSLSSNGTSTLDFRGRNSTVNYIGTVPQCAIPVAYNNLTINNTNGVSLTADGTIWGTLTLTSGTLSVGANTLTFQASDIPIIRISGTITTTTATNLSFGTPGNTGGAAFVIPAGTFISAPSINNFTINRTNSLTLNDQVLSMKGILLCNGPLITTGNMVLLSTASQTALIDGSGTGSITGEVTLQRYLDSAFGYKYFSSPFQSATVNEFSDDMDLSVDFPTFYRYDENRVSSGWVGCINPAGILNPMQGYAVNFGPDAAPVTVDITGTVNDGSQQITVCNNNNPYTLGFNLVGNPYPSPIDWDAAGGWTKTNIDNALYYFNASTTDQYSGTYSTYINGVSSDGLATNIIPSMQGFFVHVSDGSYPVSGTLGVTNGVRVKDLTHAFLKSESFDTRPLVRVTATLEETETGSDPVVIYFDDAATSSFDQEREALKLMNTDAFVPNLYSITTDEKRLSINAISFSDDSVARIPLGLKTEKDGWVTFSLKDKLQFFKDWHIYLVDDGVGISQDLTLSPLYRIFLNQGEYESRFSLVFSTTDWENPSEEEELFMLGYSGKTLIVKINLSAGTKGNLMLHRVAGQLIRQQAVAGNESVEIDLSGNRGIFIVTLIAGNKIYSKKIIQLYD